MLRAKENPRRASSNDQEALIRKRKNRDRFVICMSMMLRGGNFVRAYDS